MPEGLLQSIFAISVVAIYGICIYRAYDKAERCEEPIMECLGIVATTLIMVNGILLSIGK